MTSIAYGYEEVNNCSTLIYVVLFHYLNMWLLALSLFIWIKKLCIPTTKNNCVGCDCGICYFACVWLHFKILLLEGQDGQTWKDHVCNCVSCHLLKLCWWPSKPIFGSCFNWIILYGQSTRVANIMLICDQCSRSWRMGNIIAPFEEVLVEKWFYLGCTK